MLRCARPARLTEGHACWLLVLIALVSQLALGAMILPDDTTARQSGLTSVICRADVPMHHPGGAAPHRRGADPAL